jgi:hypothetical protein
MEQEDSYDCFLRIHDPECRKYPDCNRQIESRALFFIAAGARLTAIRWNGKAPRCSGSPF